MLTCWEGKTDSLVQEYVVYPNNKRVTTYIVEPGVNTNEIQMGTTVESAELQFLLYFFFSFFYGTQTFLQNRQN